MLDEAYIEESRCIRVITAEIKGLMLKLKDNLQEDAWLLEVEGLPETHLAMEQTLFYANETVRYDMMTEIGDEPEFQQYAHSGTTSLLKKLSGLTTEERFLYEKLVEQSLRLEQEQLPQGYAIRVLKAKGL
jgi:hypothetical protein